MSIIAGFMVPHPPLAVPSVGRGAERTIEPTLDSYEEMGKDIAKLKPDTVILASPHSVMYSDYFHISPGEEARGDFGQFGAPQTEIKVKYDVHLAALISELCMDSDFPAGLDGERDKRLDHGTMVPLAYLNKHYRDYKLIRLGLSGLPLSMHYRLGQHIKEAAEQLGRRAVFIASGDLSHCQKEKGPYGYKKEGPEYDKRIMDVMGRGAFDELLTFDEGFLEKAEVCGHRSFCIMAGALDRCSLDIRTLTHQDITGVGYGFCFYHVKGVDRDRDFLDRYLVLERERLERRRQKEDSHVSLARRTVEAYIREGRKIVVSDDLDKELLQKQAGAFVSIHENGQLRGCIGTIAPTKDCLAEEIISNAISASTRDPRFPPIEASELDSLEITVDVLGEAEDIPSKDLLDVKRYGVIVRSGYRQGLLLPDLEGVDTVDEQISIAKRKAGIREEEKVNLQRFEVIRHF